MSGGKRAAFYLRVSTPKRKKRDSAIRPRDFAPTNPHPHDLDDMTHGRVELFNAEMSDEGIIDEAGEKAADAACCVDLQQSHTVVAQEILPRVKPIRVRRGFAKKLEGYLVWIRLVREGHDARLLLVKAGTAKAGALVILGADYFQRDRQHALGSPSKEKHQCSKPHP